jgi:hypothetical protein
VTCIKKIQKCQIGVFWDSLERTGRGDSNSTARRSNGGVERTYTQYQGSNCAKILMGTTQLHSQGSKWQLGGTMGDEVGKRVIKCEMCTDNDKEGSGWESQSQNIARHVLWIVLVLWLLGQHLNRQVKLGRARASRATDWDITVKECAYAYNMSAHSATGFTCFYLVHACNPCSLYTLYWPSANPPLNSSGTQVHNIAFQ